LRQKPIVKAVTAPFTRIDHVQLAMPAGREDEARAFYAGILGMVEIRKPDELRERGGVWFQSGNAALHLGVDPAFRAATKAHPALRCASYDELVERLQMRGIAVTSDEQLVARSRHCYITDPFGNRIELIDLA
jgi:catechol 2,3-dioxygenase-like lactoylglutathione lyase family enzyme